MSRTITLIAFTIAGVVLAGVSSAGGSGASGYIPIQVGRPDRSEVVVEVGDHLWSISADHLTRHLRRAATNDEIGPFWRDVISTNLDRLISGDPDLIYPGESVLLPEMATD